MVQGKLRESGVDEPEGFKVLWYRWKLAAGTRRTPSRGRGRLACRPVERNGFLDPGQREVRRERAGLERHAQAVQIRDQSGAPVRPGWGAQ